MVTENIVITAGEKYTDIDAYACAVAYKNLMNAQGVAAEIILPGTLNESISTSVRQFPVVYQTALTNNPNDYKYVLVDVSDPSHVAAFVKEDTIIALYDHRWGFEDYWNAKSKIKVVIEPVGACATLIWEEFKNKQLTSKIMPASANLLYTAILSNTLYLKAQISTDRDRSALTELQSHTTLSQDWAMMYFNEVTESVSTDPTRAMMHDTKVVQISGNEYTIIQIELWDARPFIKDNFSEIQAQLSSATSKYRFLTAPSIKEGINYLVATDAATKNMLTDTIHATFEGDTGTTSDLWLRKEIIREIQQTNQIFIDIKPDTTW